MLSSVRLTASSKAQARSAAARLHARSAAAAATLPRTASSSRSFCAASSASTRPSLRSTASLTLPAYSWRRTLSSSTPVHGKKVVDYLLADVGEGITECEIIKWFVTPQQEVAEFDALVEVQSDKATVEITSRYAGRVVETCYEVGQVARVGSPLCRIEVEDESAPTPEPHASPAAAAVDEPSAASPSPAPAPSSSSEAESVSEDTPSQPEISTGKHATLATPAVRRISKEHGIDVSHVRGSGKEGRVTKEDIEAFIAARDQPSKSTPPAPSSSTAAAASSSAEESVALSPIRRAMFRAMTQTWTIPHFGYTEEVDVTDLDALRRSLSSSSEVGKLTLLPFLVKALSLALEAHPIFRSTLDLSDVSAPKLRQRSTHDISLALSSPFGLLTPSLPDARALSILDIAERIAYLQAKATAAPLSRADTGSPATITLSNIGSVGGCFASPLIPPTGQLAIGALGRAKLLPRYASGMEARPENVVPRLILPTSWTADHRVVEGVELANFVAEWKRLVEQPNMWFAKMR